jgi:Protein of unknown function (DUF2950)
MRILIQNETSHNSRIVSIVMGAVFALLAGHTQLSFGQEPAQKTFSSPQEGVRSLFLAVKENDKNQITGILGVEENLVSIGDKDQDQRERAQFIEKYREMHRLVRQNDGSMILYIGAENWPFPVPLVSQNGAWRFDARAGKAEILSRRIGENEEAAIEACRSLAAAEEKYKAAQGGSNAESHYAVRFAGSQGTQDGLDSGAESPIPAFLSNAGASDGATQGNARVPYSGYYFRILTQQGKHAPGGAQNYISNGQLTGGFAFVAYPAEYGQSGIMTFIVNQNNIVYQKDLGPNTADLAQAMNEYNPGPGWRRAE